MKGRTERITWDDYFLKLALAASERSTCDRAQVGAVIVRERDKKVLGTGYNGAPRGLPHCDEEEHLMRDGHCARVIHAEVNAIMQAGDEARGATIYLTHGPPCLPCTLLIIQAGVERVLYREVYTLDIDALRFLGGAGVKCVKT